MGQRVQWALLYWSEDDNHLELGAQWDFLDAPQSAKTPRFYNRWSTNSFTNVSPRLQTRWNNQIKQAYKSFTMQLFQAWTKIMDETPPHTTTTFFVFNFIPGPQSEASTNKFQTFNEHHTHSDVISINWHKSEKSGHGYNVLLVHDEQGFQRPLAHQALNNIYHYMTIPKFMNLYWPLEYL